MIWIWETWDKLTDEGTPRPGFPLQALEKTIGLRKELK
jgi:hypothetical protein